MAKSKPPHLRGHVRFGAIAPCSDAPGFVDLIIPGNINPARVKDDDPGLKHLSPYRLKNRQVLILFWNSPSRNHILAVYATDDERRVQQIFAIMQDAGDKKMERLLEKRPRYMATI